MANWRTDPDARRRSTRRAFLTAAAAWPALACIKAVLAQAPTKIRRIGFLGTGTAAGMASWVEALRVGLREHGYVEGKNLAIEYRWADGKYERAHALAAELVQRGIEILVTHGTPGTRAAKETTKTVPIVMAAAGDAVTIGLVASLAKPGGNVTGITIFNAEVAAKRVELIKEALPHITRFAALVNPDNPAMGPVREAMEPTAKSLKLELKYAEVRGPADLKSAFAAMVAQKTGAVVIVEDGMINANTPQIAELAVKLRLPAIGITELAEAGCLMAYGASLADMYRRAAYFVDRILKGTRPGDIPIERAAKFETVLNLKTATALGIKFPQSILVQATKVIE
ncbi:MAG TPA: ABC transporter substrate-binding protein [Burkholderiales bacterium]|nr:ABC transporter substrate-binding protein [Burkholderiales bacterium]